MPLFDQIVPRYMAKLMADFDCTAEDAAAVFGNAGHESAGFEKLQEIKPVVPGSRGGWGWFQWTGPRRRQFEAYCQRNNLDPRAPDTNYAFLFVELTTTERAMPHVKRTVGLHAKTKVFEQKFERAGVKHYPSRYRWAERALRAYHADNPEVPPPPDIEPVEPPAAKPKQSLTVARLIGGFFNWLIRHLTKGN